MVWASSQHGNLWDVTLSIWWLAFPRASVLGETDKSQKASYDQVLEVRQLRFYHILLAKTVINQPRFKGTEEQFLFSIRKWLAFTKREGTDGGHLGENLLTF